jgi:hypothetical protein
VSTMSTRHAEPEQEVSMPIATRQAEIVWEGPLASGTGALSSGSGALGGLPASILQ